MKKLLKGRSMIEMLGALAIIGMLSVGGLYVYRQALIRHQINQVKDFTRRIDFTFKEQCVYADECRFMRSNWSAEEALHNRAILCQAGNADMCTISQSMMTKFPYIGNTQWMLLSSGPIKDLWYWFYLYAVSQNICEHIISKDVDLNNPQVQRIQLNRIDYFRRADNTFKDGSSNLLSTDKCNQSNDFAWGTKIK